MTAIKRSLRGRALIDGELVDDVTIEIDGSMISTVRIGASTGVRHEGLIAPGFIDLHVHGGAGHDFMDGTVDAARQVCAHHARHGTTGLMATTLSADGDAIDAAVAAIREATADGERGAPDGARILGLHLEGPFLNPQKAGAQDVDALRPASATELEGWLRLWDARPVMMTLAPEIDGALALIEQYSDRVLFSVGHTMASFEHAEAAFRAGAGHATHLFNAMTGLHHRRPGVVGAVLAHAEVSAEIISDGHHVHPAVVGAMARALDSRLALVTDAMRACGMPDGRYSLHRYDVDVADGAARLADGTLAGSVLTMDAAVRTAVSSAGVPLATALEMASRVPARALGLADRGAIAPGHAADLVVLDDDLRVSQVLLDGEVL